MEKMGEKRSISIRVIVLIVLAVSSSQSALATIVTVKVEGVVNSITTYGSLALDGSVSTGSTMTGSCSYNTDTPDKDASDTHGTYSLISLSMSVGNYTFTHDPQSAESALFDIWTIDYCYSAHSSAARFEGTVYVDGEPRTFEQVTWREKNLEPIDLRSSTNEYGYSDALQDVDTFPELSVFNWEKSFELLFVEKDAGDGYKGYFDIYGEVTSLTAVPEPPAPANSFLVCLKRVSCLMVRDLYLVKRIS